MKVALWLIVLLLVACSGQATPDVTVTPALVGQVMIQSPQAGTVYYSETLVIRGASSQLSAEGFTLNLLDANDKILQSQTVVPVNDRWELLVPFETSETMTITIRAEGTRGQGVYDEVTAALGLLSERPQGGYALFYSPSQEDVVGGEEFEITGVVSGLEGQSILLYATDEMGVTVVEMSILPDHLSPLDEVPFRVDVSIESITGPLRLELRVGETVYDTLLVFVSVTAG